MALRNGKALTWRPRGVTDTLDSTASGPGSMMALSNLTPDQTTPGLYRCRAASTVLTPYFAAATPPPTIFITLGNLLYGMRPNVTGTDTPFVVNLDTGAYSEPTGYTAANTPTTQPITGDWVPPCMETLGHYILVIHPGFNGAGNGYIGWLDISTPSAPTWNSGTTATNALAGVPVDMFVFSGRMYYAVGNAVEASDELDPLTRTNAGQVLTLGDSTPITVLFGLPLNNTVTGGILQALLAFKGEGGNIYQVTGDYASTATPWTVNDLNVSVGCAAANSVVSTPNGVYFQAVDGYRLIGFNGLVGPPIGQFGAGVTVPFQDAPTPTRTTAAFNMQTLRIAVRTPSDTIASTVEYWLNTTTNTWTGPHPLPTQFLAAYNDTFIAAMEPPDPNWQRALFWTGVLPTSTDGYTEFGLPMSFTYQTSNLPNNQHLTNNSLAETTILMGFLGSNPAAVDVQLVDISGIILCDVPVVPTGQSPYWGVAVWGVDVWGGTQPTLYARFVPWNGPIVFQQGSLLATGLSASGFRIGTSYFKYQEIEHSLLPGPYPQWFVLDQSTLDGPDIMHP